MPITLGDHALPEAETTVREVYEVVGGRETRVIRIVGLMRGATTAGIVAALDLVARAASEGAPVPVSLRPGRRLLARREAFSRELNEKARIGQFAIDLRAEAAWEESTTLREIPWEVGASGQDIDLENNGTFPVPPTIVIAAEDDLVRPTLSDGARTLQYTGNLPNGSILELHGESGRAWLDGDEVTPYVDGDFPQVAPGGSTLVYTDDPSSSHLAALTIRYRDRWW